jgi:hypothetical protein
MTLNKSLAYAVNDIAARFPNDITAAVRELREFCKLHGLKAPANPKQYFRTWRGRVDASGELESHASKSGRPKKFTAKDVEAAYAASLDWDKAGRSFPYESQEELAFECPGIKQLLARTRGVIGTLCNRIRKKHKRWGRYELHAKKKLSKQNKLERVEVCTTLSKKFGKQLSRVLQFDATTVYIQKGQLYGYVDPDNPRPIRGIKPARKSGRVLRVKYYSAVSTDLGAFFFQPCTGTTDFKPTLRSTAYKVRGLSNSMGLPPPITWSIACCTCPCHTTASLRAATGSGFTHSHTTVHPCSTATSAKPLSRSCCSSTLPTFQLLLLMGLSLCPCPCTSINTWAGLVIIMSQGFLLG